MACFGSLGGFYGQTVTRIPQKLGFLRQYLQTLFARLLHCYVQAGVLGLTKSVPVPDNCFASAQYSRTGRRILTFARIHPIFDLVDA